MSTNPIYPGFPWEQAFRVGPGSLDPAADLRIALVRRGNRLGAIVANQTLRRDAPGTWSLVLSAQITEGWPEGHVVGDLVAIEDGVERPLGVRVTIPVIRSLTPPAP